MKTKSESVKMVPLATRVEKGVLAQLKGIAKEEYCPISVLVRKAIDLLGEAFQKSVLPEHLLKRIPRLQHPVGVTIRVDPLQATRLKTLATDEGYSVSDLLRAAIQHFIILYQGPESRASMTEFLNMPSSRVRISAEVDAEVTERLEAIAHERNEPLYSVIGEALRIYVDFHDNKALGEVLHKTRDLLTYLTIVLPLSKEASGKTLEEAIREYMDMPRGETDERGLSQIGDAKEGGGNGKTERNPNKGG